MCVMVSIVIFLSAYTSYDLVIDTTVPETHAVTGSTSFDFCFLVRNVMM